jgi:hypothetical protein
MRLGAGLLAVGCAPGAAGEEGLRVRAALAVSQLHDDNIFATRSTRTADDIFRMSPRLEIGHRPGRFTLLARAGVDGEIYRLHPDLNTPTARQEADFLVAWAPSKRFTASTLASYAESANAGELNTLVGLTVGRVPARRLAASGALGWQVGARTHVGLDHTFTRDAVETLPDTDAYTASATLSRQFSPTDQGRLRYVARRFVFAGLSTTSHVVTLGWTGDLRPLTHVELAAGPSRTADTITPEVSVRLRQQFRRGEMSLGYVRTQTTVVGRPGPVAAQGVSATFYRRLARAVEFAATPSLYRVDGTGSRTTVQQIGVEVRYRLGQRYSVALAHAYTVQRGALYVSDDPGLDTSDVVRNVLALRIAAGPAGRAR